MDDVGIKIHKLKHLKLYGKILLADELPASLVRSFSPGSFDTRRELAIEVHDSDAVHRLHKVAHHDWNHSHRIDLSDEGLVADLDSRIKAGAEILALDAKDEDEG